MRYSNAIRWYIKWWWAVGIAWFVSFFVLYFIKTGKFIVIPKNVYYIIYFPIFIFTWILGRLGDVAVGLDIAGVIIYSLMFIFFLIPCYILAMIFKLLLREKDK